MELLLELCWDECEKSSLLTLQMWSHVVRQSDAALQVLAVAKSLLEDVAARGEQVPAGRCQFSLRAVTLSWYLLNSNRANKNFQGLQELCSSFSPFLLKKKKVNFLVHIVGLHL